MAMAQYTNYAVPVPGRRISSVSPWPSDAQIIRVARAWFAYYTRPARPFPAANYCPLSAKPATRERRFPTEKMPAVTLAEWEQEQWVWMDRQRVPTRPARHVGRFERCLDWLITQRQRIGKRT